MNIVFWLYNLNCFKISFQNMEFANLATSRSIQEPLAGDGVVSRHILGTIVENKPAVRIAAAWEGLKGNIR